MQICQELELPDAPLSLSLDGFLLRPTEAADVIRDGDLLQLNASGPMVRWSAFEHTTLFVN